MIGAVLAALLSVAPAPGAAAPPPATPDPSLATTGARREGEPARRPRTEPDPELLRELELLQNMELLDHLELFE